MTVQREQVATAQRAGILDDIAIDAASVADELRMSYYQLLALIEKETTNGKNCYGNDAGGTFSGFRDLVTEANYRAFRHEVMVRGRPSNGVGVLQITYKPFFAEMEAGGLQPWIPRDNLYFGGGLYHSYFLAQRAEGWSMKSSIRRAGTKYNSGEYGFIAYGDRLWELAVKWRELVGVADVT